MASPSPSPSAIYPSLHSKVILITGGAEGIGAATTELFCRQNARVCILDIAPASATALIKHISTLNPFHPAFPISTPRFYHADVTDLARLRAIVAEIEAEFGGVDVLVNNAAAAGGSARKATLDVGERDWSWSMDVNLRHVFFLTQAVVPSMRRRGGGAIINMGSISWRIPATGTPVYIAAKAAILGLTKTHAKEFGADNIRVNSVMPGAIATARQRAEVYGPDPAYREFCLAQQTLKRDLEPSEVAAVVGFLASADAGAVTGSSYVVDGGWVSDV